MENKPVDEVKEWLSSHSIDEHVLLSPLLEGSTRFSKLMNCLNEKRKSLQIFWVDNSIIDQSTPFYPLQDNERACVSKIDSGTRVIVIRNDSSVFSNETIIAHELSHIILELEGFPLVELTESAESSKDSRRLLLPMNNMLHDPLVIIKLISFEYDLKGEYSRDCKGEIPQYDEIYNSTEMIKTFNYVQYRLENEILFGSIKNPCMEYNIRFGKKYKTARRKGKSLYEIIHKIGFSTPENLSTVYNAIINECNLFDLVKEIPIDNGVKTQ